MVGSLVEESQLNASFWVRYCTTINTSLIHLSFITVSAHLYAVCKPQLSRLRRCLVLLPQADIECGVAGAVKGPSRALKEAKISRATFTLLLWYVQCSFDVWSGGWGCAEYRYARSEVHGPTK
jgi:hypothetical protein